MGKEMPIVISYKKGGKTYVVEKAIKQAIEEAQKKPRTQASKSIHNK